MCIAATTLHDGTQVACHKCWQCRERAINDWVGRNIAESKTSIASHAITLTYGRNSASEVTHERTVLLTYSDVQKYLKLLRRHGYPVRYFITGEFGSKFGRAHWHVMLYWQRAVPEHVLDMNFMEQHWPHGWSFWTMPTPQAVRYNCKYIQKDMGDALRQGHIGMSRKPPLGAVYFRGVAERYVQQGLAPQTLVYTFPDVRRTKKEGSEEVVPFMLTGRSAELFLDHYVRAWERAHGARPRPASQLVDWFVEFGRVPSERWVDDQRREALEAREDEARKAARVWKRSTQLTLDELDALDAAALAAQGLERLERWQEEATGMRYRVLTAEERAQRREELAARLASVDADMQVLWSRPIRSGRRA